MKQIILKLMRVISLASFAVIFSRNEVQAQCAAHPAEVLLSMEKQILDIEDYFKSPKKAAALTDSFDYNFRYTAALNNINNAEETICMSAMIQLYDMALNAVSCDEYITGLRIIIALNGNTMQQFYQPVYMCFNEQEFPETRAEYNVIDVAAATFYKYNPGTNTFVVATATDLNNTTNYYRDIRISHDANRTNFEPFVDTTTWRGDTKSMIISFQEIFKLYNDNYGAEAPAKRYQQNIIVCNGAKNYRKWDNNPFNNNQYILKHTLYIKTNINGNLLYAANLAHLCPPSCTKLKYFTESW